MKNILDPLFLPQIGLIQPKNPISRYCPFKLSLSLCRLILFVLSLQLSSCSHNSIQTIFTILPFIISLLFSPLSFLLVYYFIFLYLYILICICLSSLFCLYILGSVGTSTVLLFSDNSISRFLNLFSLPLFFPFPIFS